MSTQTPTHYDKWGYLIIVLHYHLPFIYHPEYSDPFEEDWLHEAVRETYLPLLIAFNRLANMGIKYQVTVSFSGSLMQMLLNPLLQERMYNKLKKSLKLAEMEVERTSKEAKEFHEAAKMYYRIYRDNLHTFEELGGDILKGYKELAEKGFLEIITSNATHAFMPLLALDEAGKIAVRNQIEIAVQNFYDYFGWLPKGMWLPECAYFEGLDKILTDAGIKYTFLEHHGIMYGKPYPVYGTFLPYKTSNGLFLFGRDPECSRQVWSAKEGYPGDFDYREFYRDIGYDLPLEYIREFIHESGMRKDTGIKYYRITGTNVPLGEKKPYIPQTARAKAELHAGNFMFNRERQVEYWYKTLGLGIPLAITAPYDAELFGHWWFEGPWFLEDLLRKIYETNSQYLGTITPSQYIENWGDKLAELEPNPSSWGWKGYYEVWLNGSNDYIYRHLHLVTGELVKLATELENTDDPKIELAMNQAVRELLQAQCSDWPFIMFTGTVTLYAANRFKRHILNLHRLIEAIRSGQIDEKLVEQMYNYNPAFKVDFRRYSMNTLKT